MSMGGIEDYGSPFSACAYLYPGLVWVLGFLYRLMSVLDHLGLLSPLDKS